MHHSQRKTQRLQWSRSSATRLRLVLEFLILEFCVVSCALAQQPLDRVMARIGSNAVTLTDVKAAVGLGLVDAKSPDDSAALSQVIDRQVMLMEVARFPPAEPSDVAINQ